MVTLRVYFRPHLVRILLIWFIPRGRNTSRSVVSLPHNMLFPLWSMNKNKMDVTEHFLNTLQEHWSLPSDRYSKKAPIPCLLWCHRDRMYCWRQEVIASITANYRPLDDTMMCKVYLILNFIGCAALFAATSNIAYHQHTKFQNLMYH